MSSTLKPQTLGRKPEDGQARAAMLSRLGIAEAPQDELYQEPAPEPAAQVEALAAPPPEEPPTLTPALDRLRAWASPANDERVEAAEEKPAFAIPAPPPEVEVEVEVEEDPFEAIRQKYRNPPKTMALAPGITLPSNIPLPTSLPIPKVPLKIARVGERRRKAGELSMVRKVIWGLSTLAALTLGWALFKGDESSFLVQMFGALLP
ncbi:MAG TPA: hypothetical protein VF122_01780 [Caulobacteraceae bacterium]